MAWSRWWERSGKRTVRAGGDAWNVFSGGVVSVVVQGRPVAVRLPRDASDAVRGLPPAPAVFTGREGELAHVEHVFGPFAPDGSDAERAVSVVAGAAGAGKSALALRVAHDLVAAAWFSGGAVYVGLGGPDGGHGPGTDGIAVEALGALGVPDEAIPASAEARMTAVRAVLTGLADAGHRVLIVLDDVSSREQVLSVLPGSEAHPVLVTSRHGLAGVGTVTTELRTLPARAASDLVRATLQDACPGDVRLRDDDPATRELVAMCGGLPLALRLVAGCLTLSPDLAPAVLAAAVCDDIRRPDGLDDGERAVRAGLHVSYGRLVCVGDTDAAHLLRVAAAESPGTTLTVEAAATLSGLDHTTTVRAIADLERAHLIEPAGPGRHRMHDLVRLYARALPDV